MELKGSRFSIRRLEKKDAESIYRHVNEKDIARNTTIPHPYKIDMAYDFIRKSQLHIRKGTDYELGIEWKETGEIIGMISLLSLDNDHKNAELGYWLSKEYWRRGIMSEAISLMLRFGFKKLGLVRIYAKVLHTNDASAKLLEKLGFCHEGTHRKSMFRWGRWHDDKMYALLKDEWKG